MTGVAVFSWIGARLVVWRGDAQLWLPDQICDDIFAVDDAWAPTEIGVEATGLEEFIMQPLRHRAISRRQLLPLRRLIPPRGKDSFIRGLQPFFKSGQVDFVDVSAEARGQLLSFPTGRKDFPNALAYALMMKPGLPVYDISREHMIETLTRLPGQPWWLAVNATNQYTTAALIQVIDGQIRVHADWVREGPPGEVLADTVAQARLESGGRVAGAFRLMVKPAGSSDVVGLRVAVRALQLDPRAGGDIVRGRERLRDLLTRRKRDQPLFVVAHGARWVLNGMAGGYSHSVGKRGELSREPDEGPYQVLMEGIESFAAVLDIAQDEDIPRRAVGEDGREYTTILATAAPPAPAKDEWYRPDVVNSARTLSRGQA
jgi:hypothetical protein